MPRLPVLRSVPVPRRRDAPSVTSIAFSNMPEQKIRIRRHPQTRLPIPHVKQLLVREWHQDRMLDHYHTTLQEDLMYMSYFHEPLPRPPPRAIRTRFDPDDPYVKYRANPPVAHAPSAPENVIRLEKISLQIFTKEAITNRSNLLGPIMALRALSGETERGGGYRTSEGVQIIRGKKSVGGWIRKGIPCGARVDMRGQEMYSFLSTLTEFVLPRMREFGGIKLPTAMTSGAAFGYFPQLEVNLDAYPKPYGMHIHFVTSAQGVGASNLARSLMSGLQIPFSRR
ncbi:ribosomal protein L5 domain-containing protein [Schizophyllum amplum]|uniref:Ribosomal protein L5 domain-containing protein n=1 Tax=Schizophyllum amplum TaxID=97359 RepID=A0A550CBH8_9AGAR|nr:ribosomal protein L5 domain-containing protein [Auriculariopsis ampla]